MCKSLKVVFSFVRILSFLVTFGLASSSFAAGPEEELQAVKFPEFGDGIVDYFHYRAMELGRGIQSIVYRMHDPRFVSRVPHSTTRGVRFWFLALTDDERSFLRTDVGADIEGYQLLERVGGPRLHGIVPRVRNARGECVPGFVVER